MTTCPTCSCETNGDHTCPHTKAPTTRELDAKIKRLDETSDTHHKFLLGVQERLEALERALSKLDNRIESHSMSIMYLTQAVKGSGENISNAFVEIHKLADHHDALGHQHIELEIERLKDQLRTIGRAVIDSPTGIVCSRLEPIVRPVPEVEGDEAERAANHENTGSSTVERHAIAEPGKGQPDIKAAEGGNVGSIPTPCSTYKLTDEEREEGRSNYLNVSWDIFATWVESLVTRAVRDAIKHGVGGRGTALSGSGTHTSAADSALPNHPDIGPEFVSAYFAPRVAAKPAPTDFALPERPDRIDEPWRLEHFEPGTDDDAGVYRDNFETAEEYRIYALALESRLAEAEKERASWMEHSMRYERDAKRSESEVHALKAKLAEAQTELERERLRLSACGVSARGGSHLYSMVDEYKSDSLDAVNEMRASRDALRAKLDGVREAAEKWEMSQDAFEMYNGGRTVKASLDRVGRFAIKSALAAAENTNTGDAAGTVTRSAPESSQTCDLGDESQGAREPTHHTVVEQATGGVNPLRTSVQGSGLSTAKVPSQAGSTPAVSHPSPAPAFEMTFNQRFELLLSRDDPLKLVRCVTDLVRTALRDSREGWVTRDVARTAMERWGANRHADALHHARKLCMAEETLDGMLSAAERDAASKGAQ